MKYLLVTVALFLSLVSNGQSTVSAKKEKIKKLFVLMQQDSLILKSLDGMAASMVKNMSAIINDSVYSKYDIDVSKIYQKFMDKTMKRSKENALNLLHVEMVDIYDKYFSEEEINDFSIFYASKSGKKMITQMPDITKDVMNIMLTKYQVDFQQSIAKDVQELMAEIQEQVKAKQQ